MSPPARPRSGSGLSPLIPLAYLACAAVAFLAASLSVSWLAPELTGHYYHPRLLALTHTVTLGWVTLAIMGAGYQLIPIVLEREIWSERLARWQLAILAVAVTGMVAHFQLGTWPGLATAAGLLAIGIALHLLNVGMSLRGFTRWRSGLLVAGALAVAAAAGAHVAWACEMAWGRKRPGLDWGLRFVLTATAFLAPVAVIGVAMATDHLAGPRVALGYAVVMLGGWISLTMIVPFLVWYRAFSPRAGREPVPTLAQLSWPRAEGLANVLLTGGVALLAATALVGEATGIRAAGALLALGALAFAAALARVLGYLSARARTWSPQARALVNVRARDV